MTVLVNRKGNAIAFLKCLPEQLFSLTHSNIAANSLNSEAVFSSSQSSNSSIPITPSTTLLITVPNFLTKDWLTRRYCLFYNIGGSTDSTCMSDRVL